MSKRGRTSFHGTDLNQKAALPKIPEQEGLWENIGLL